MKKILYFGFAALCTAAFCGCTTTAHVTSYSVFANTLEEVAKDIEGEGFMLVDIDKTQKSEVALSTRSRTINDVPSSQSAGEFISNSANARYGFHNEDRSDYIYTHAYTFENSEGERVRYSVSFRAGNFPLTNPFHVSDVVTTGCETTNPSHYDRFCGKSSPLHRLENMPKDTTIVL
ncbi:MAG: hypothetical protein IJ634_03655 [Bacteroidales bacterium]|nr:hypothetical protein [Bacteroidales bacterium]